MTSPATEKPAIVSLPSGIPPQRARLTDWVRVARPRQWIKNLVIFAGLIFTGSFRDTYALWHTLEAFVLFCLLSSAGYMINDTLDIEKDRAHPQKCTRPIAAGRIRPAAAMTVAFMLLCISLTDAYRLDPRLCLAGGVYMSVLFLYSWVLKHQVIVDIIAIAAGFLLRALAGTVVIDVTLSSWLFICVFLLALMLGFGKRRHELALLTSESHDHRPVLTQYSITFLDQAMTAMLGASIMAYALYAILSPTALMHPMLVYTVPTVVYAMLRYVYLVQHCGQGGQPEEIFLTDRPMLITVALWGLAVTVVMLLR